MNTLEKRELIKGSGIFVSPLCLGCAPLGNLPNDFGHEVSRTDALLILNKVFSNRETGINFLDTSRNYGESEERIGQALKEFGSNPPNLIIATKADRDPDTNLFEPAQIRKSVEESRKALGLTILPLVYLHDPERHPDYLIDNQIFFDTIMNGAVKELETMQSEGIIGHIGISGGPIDMLMKFVRTKKFNVVITHNRYNLLYRNAKPLIELANKENVTVINAGVFASGILVDIPNKNVTLSYQKPSDENLKRVASMRALCKKYEVPLESAALQFSLKSSVTSTAVGISSVEELEHLYSLLAYTVPENLLEELHSLCITDEDPEEYRIR